VYRGSSVIPLGEATVEGECSYRVTFTVPDVAPNTYALVLVDHGRGSATELGTINFVVTG
jgi:hypothetical protein